MIQAKNNAGFQIPGENGTTVGVPAGSEIYVHFADNGNKEIEVHGKVLKDKAEIAWVRPKTQDGRLKIVKPDSPTMLSLIHI